MIGLTPNQLRLLRELDHHGGVLIVRVAFADEGELGLSRVARDNLPPREACEF